MSYDVFVLTHHKKRSTVSEILREAGITHTVYVNPDIELPPQHAEWATDRSWRPQQRDYALRQYRAITGHRKIMAMPTICDYRVVFEDDMQLACTPAAFKEFMTVQLNDICENMFTNRNTVTGDTFDAISLHGRNLSPAAQHLQVSGYAFQELAPRVIHERAQQEFLRPLWDVSKVAKAPLTLRWHEGCLAYVVNEYARRRWVMCDVMAGWPCDLFLVNIINTAVMTESLFKHGEQYGSLMTGSVVI